MNAKYNMLFDPICEVKSD